MRVRRLKNLTWRRKIMFKSVKKILYLYGGIMKNSDLKKQAKAVIYREGAGKAIGLFIIPIVVSILNFIYNTGRSFSAMMANYRYVMGLTTVKPVAQSSVMTDVVFPILGIFVLFVGISITFTLIAMFREKERKINAQADMFQVFKRDVFFKVLCLQLWQFLFLFLWTLLFVIPGIVKAFSYSQSNMILFDKLKDGTYTNSRDIITESRVMMNGYKGKYFYMILSFIGWSILISITFGFAGIYVYPFAAATLVAFYENLKNGNLKTI